MKMVGEGTNQSKNTLKRIKVEEEEGEDRISLLPDCLLLEILSRLPSTKSAIRTGTLSKRWKYLWTLVSTLIFELASYMRPFSDFVSFVDKTLTQCRQSKLRKFAVYTTYDTQFESQVNNWIRYAICCNVEELELRFAYVDSEEFTLKEDFLVNPCFTNLKLSYCIINPNGAIGWKRLRSLSIGHVYLDENLVQNILTGSPLLETLVLETCYGCKRLDITSKSVQKLVFSGYSDPDDGCDFADIIKINAPNILSLTIGGLLLLWKILLLNVSSLVEANIDYEQLGHYETTRKEAKEEMLKRFIQSLRHVKVLKIGVSCSKVLFRLEAKGFIFPSNVKFPDVTYNDNDSVGSSDYENHSDNYSVESNETDSDNDSVESSDGETYSDNDSVESSDRSTDLDSDSDNSSLGQGDWSN